tara:strand:+ start:244 stop:642 length:399 start_codon:yes stop_codon:yes gene_type:complete
MYKKILFNEVSMLDYITDENKKATIDTDYNNKILSFDEFFYSNLKNMFENKDILNNYVLDEIEKTLLKIEQIKNDQVVISNVLNKNIRDVKMVRKKVDYIQKLKNPYNNSIKKKIKLVHNNNKTTIFKLNKI